MSFNLKLHPYKSSEIVGIWPCNIFYDLMIINKISNNKLNRVVLKLYVTFITFANYFPKFKMLILIEENNLWITGIHVLIWISVIPIFAITQTHIFLNGTINLSWLVWNPYYMYLITVEKIISRFWIEQIFLYCLMSMTEDILKLSKSFNYSAMAFECTNKQFNKTYNKILLY